MSSNSSERWFVSPSYWRKPRRRRAPKSESIGRAAITTNSSSSPAIRTECSSRCERDGAVPCMVLLLSANQAGGGCLLVEEPRAGRGAEPVLRLRRARRRRQRSRSPRIWNSASTAPAAITKSFDTQPDNSGAACAAACKGEQQCRAWTYVRPGYQGAAAHCYLKAKVTIPRHKPCCLSGVITINFGRPLSPRRLLRVQISQQRLVRHRRGLRLSICRSCLAWC